MASCVSRELDGTNIFSVAKDMEKSPGKLAKHPDLKKSFIRAAPQPYVSF